MERVLPENKTIQVGSGKLNTSREKHFEVVIARNPFSEQTC
jgi:hypothetical protein